MPRELTYDESGRLENMIGPTPGHPNIKVTSLTSNPVITRPLSFIFINSFLSFVSSFSYVEFQVSMYAHVYCLLWRIIGRRQACVLKICKNVASKTFITSLDLIFSADHEGFNQMK
jgi:hypothetical protein